VYIVLFCVCSFEQFCTALHYVHIVLHYMLYILGLFCTTLANVFEVLIKCYSLDSYT